MSQQQQQQQTSLNQSSLLIAIESVKVDLGQQIASITRAFEQFRDTMPDAYVPRRELSEIHTGLRAQAANHDTRLAMLEEYRLAETRAAAERQATLQAQINATVVAAMKDNIAVGKEAAAAVSNDRKEQDERTITWQRQQLYALLYSAIGLVVGIISAVIITHLPR
ncbi:MAG: hypothetical protein IVW57_00135 [Ktedonobacterales bacterium]|nr:hypothetical protein [Ktedonobacterales bacterium]